MEARVAANARDASTAATLAKKQIEEKQAALEKKQAELAEGYAARRVLVSRARGHATVGDAGR